MTKPKFLYQKEELSIYDLFILLYSITTFYSISFLLYFFPANSIGDGTFLEFLNNCLNIFLSMVNICSYFVIICFGFFMQGFTAKKYKTIITIHFLIGIFFLLNFHDVFLETFNFHFDLILKAYFISIFSIYFLMKNNILVQKLAKASIYFYMFIFAFLGITYSQFKTTNDLTGIDKTSFVQSMPWLCEDTYINFNGYLHYEKTNCPYNNLSEIERFKKYAESGSLYSYWKYLSMFNRSNHQPIEELIETTEKHIKNNTKIYNSWLYHNIPSIVNNSLHSFNKEELEKENDINIKTIELFKSNELDSLKIYIEKTENKTFFQKLLYKKIFQMNLIPHN